MNIQLPNLTELSTYLQLSEHEFGVLGRAIWFSSRDGEKGKKSNLTFDCDYALYRAA